jgi:hypothetical protein
MGQARHKACGAKRPAHRFYIFGTICPKEGKGAGLVLPVCNIEAMNLHLAEIAPPRSRQARSPCSSWIRRDGWTFFRAAGRQRSDREGLVPLGTLRLRLARIRLARRLAARAGLRLSPWLDQSVGQSGLQLVRPCKADERLTGGLDSIHARCVESLRKMQKGPASFRLRGQ